MGHTAEKGYIHTIGCTRFARLLLGGAVLLLLAGLVGCSVPFGAPASNGSGSSSGGAGNAGAPPLESGSDLESALVSYWAFEDGAGTTASDTGGSGNGGTVFGGATWTSGRRGGALNFDGVDDYVSIPHADSVNFGGAGADSYAVAMWFYPESLSGYHHVISKLGTEDEDAANGPSPFELFTGGESASFYVKDGSGAGADANFSVGGVSVSLEAWQHVVLVRDGEALSIYIDGTHAATATATGIGETTANTEPITIGQRGDDDIFFDGSIDEVAVFSRALTGPEVSQLYGSY
jgi:hypothetical protein